MQKLLIFSFLLLCPINCFAENPDSTKKKDSQKEVSTYIKMTSSATNGQIDIGVDISNESFVIRPTVSIPITLKSGNISRLDRFTTDWKGNVLFQWNYIKSNYNQDIDEHSFGVQAGVGLNEYKYYPAGTKESETRTYKSSFTAELVYSGFIKRVNDTTTRQFFPQAMLRYSYNREASKEAGIMNPPNSMGLVTVSNMILEAPFAVPILSLAVSLPMLLDNSNNGDNRFSFAPTVYYDFIGVRNNGNPFNDVQRLQLECWLFYHSRTNRETIGISPYVSIRTVGKGNLAPVEFGGMITFKINNGQQFWKMF